MLLTKEGDITQIEENRRGILGKKKIEGTLHPFLEPRAWRRTRKKTHQQQKKQRWVSAIPNLPLRTPQNYDDCHKPSPLTTQPEALRIENSRRRR